MSESVGAEEDVDGGDATEDVEAGDATDNPNPGEATEDSDAGEAQDLEDVGDIAHRDHSAVGIRAESTHRFVHSKDGPRSLPAFPPARDNARDSSSSVELLPPRNLTDDDVPSLAEVPAAPFFFDPQYQVHLKTEATRLFTNVRQRALNAVQSLAISSPTLDTSIPRKKQVADKVLAVVARNWDLLAKERRGNVVRSNEVRVAVLFNFQVQGEKWRI
ncbi:unnamed protein product [Cyprideis torosa]|uniref:Uncharacterized protein n=1 Tax=Cyprideis torosa TaxID=163714 RepID=A0A7R8W611_9CRUS|nr:unnamed protein product [Cyprideis torosa]CAG0880837.1 unnamed protein product [Cyprideis torosa]